MFWFQMSDTLLVLKWKSDPITTRPMLSHELYALSPEGQDLRIVCESTHYLSTKIFPSGQVSPTIIDGKLVTANCGAPVFRHNLTPLMQLGAQAIPLNLGLSPRLSAPVVTEWMSEKAHRSLMIHHLANHALEMEKLAESWSEIEALVPRPLKRKEKTKRKERRPMRLPIAPPILTKEDPFEYGTVTITEDVDSDETLPACSPGTSNQQ